MIAFVSVNATFCLSETQ